MSRRPSRARPAAQKKAQAPTPPPAPRWTERLRPWHVAAALAALHLLLAGLAFDPTPNPGGDNAAYVALARSLLERGTYQELWDPAMRPHVQYPPGWPLILAAGRIVGVTSWVGMKVMVLLFSVLAVTLSYLWARRVSTRGVALAVGLLLAVGPGVLATAHSELSDVPFWAFTMLALWAFARARPADAGPVMSTDGGTLWPLAIAAAATLAAYATRSAGLPLVLAAGGWLTWKRRWRDLAILAGVVLPFAVAWWMRARTMDGPGYTSFLWYVDPYRPSLGMVTFGGMLERVARNTGKYVGEHIPVLLIGARNTALATAVGVTVVGLAAAGWALRVSRAGVAEFLLPLYLGLVLVWPAEWAGQRFILPVLPLLLLYAAETVRAGADRVGAARVAGVAATGLVLLMALPAQKVAVSAGSYCRKEFRRGEPFPCVLPVWQDFFELAGQTRGTLPKGSVVLSRKPTLFWALSGYPSRTYPFSAEPDTLLRTAREAGAEYVVADGVDNLAAMYLAPVLIRRSKGFCVVRSMGPDGPTLMGILPNAERAPDTGSGREGETVTLGFAGCGPAYRAGPDGGRLGPEHLLR
ncbi:MAG TPA: hypothetical protein VGB24_08765 [Longimicrobium sp.]|uniref:ArnT family glycosyltransferase n=1 Tax=Longimicrobium sp. TaxID=2029185 RepID=UPI002EDB713B